MEFSISKKAKTVTTALMGVGLLFTAIGIFTSMSDHHFATRLLVNGLVNSFFFFAL
ncbi:MAG: hypothetical protein RL679_975, partial [Bacteroidota bacterium]